MFEKLFGVKRQEAAAPAGARLYAVGDVHGRADLLDRLLEMIAAEDAGGARKRLVFLGDYVDRGPDSRGVLDRLAALKEAEPDAVFLKGNHEEALLDFLEDPEGMSEWLDWGGAATLRSYGVAPEGDRAPAALAAALRARLPDAHRAFLRDLSLYEVAGDYLFVHAGLRPGLPLAEQKARDLLWIRDAFHNAPPHKRPDKVVVHGHHPVRRPLDAGWRIDVDTGACFSGMLTAVVLEGTSRRFLST
ncbi:metallophosphoesterase family protein [Amphiplicatus metriothermophilus]|uniref:metallophosphoesterase family protein n=1 Tax=Amphiplicatus metriothermophilus TaxID=1519374 RepID=UPI000B792847|nr:metallophosphoesterase family protein [Amphiplicatus metriothermophilus]MBB5519691.1 serine/threonine protein phosphatase 1 [Amphiplicatus metriothermophilus]